MKALSSFRATVCFALDLSLIRSPASLCPRARLCFSAYQRPVGGNASLLFIWLWVSRNLVGWSLPGCGFLPFACFPYFWYRPTLQWNWSRGREATESSGSADRSRALCSNVISITLTESLEGSNDDLTFLSRLPVGFFFFMKTNAMKMQVWLSEKWLLMVCLKTKQALLTKPWSLCLFPLWCHCVFVVFSLKKKDSENFISWDFIWFQESVENESSLTWGFVMALRESFLLCGSVPPLCSLILSPRVQR